MTLGAIAPELFVLRVAYAPNAVAGAAYQLRVQAVNPVTRRAVSGVEVTGVFKPDAGAPEIAAPAAAQTTNGAGEAVVRWPPKAVSDGTSGEIVISGRKGAQSQHTSVGVTFSPRHTFVVSTDKPLYQPGQALHVRTLLFDNRKRAVSGAAVQFTLRDPDHATLFRGTTTTNRFGVACIDWDLPDSVRLGDYELLAELTGPEGAERPGGYSIVRIRRYDLPTFTVSVATDRPYYLPRQDAVLAVDANYLFGRPVSGGTVRVVREVEHRWDYAKQAWVTQEEGAWTSELDAKGHATVVVPLAAISEQLEGSPWARYEDVTYAAHVTDRSTGKTEQRRVSVRVSRDPIHVYVTGERRLGRTVSFYVTTSYPDGAPAAAAVQISQRWKSDVVHVLRSLRTNRFGAARVTHLDLESEGDEVEDATIVIEARDKAGNRGTREAEPHWFPKPNVEIITDKTVYRPGESMTVSITSSESTPVVLDAVRAGDTVWSTRIAVRRGRGFSVVPYREQFQGPITLVAYPLGTSDDNIAASHRTVLYPHDTDLRVSIRPARRTYAPGDDFNATIRVRTPTGIAAASALGVTMLDRAVDERARTDEEFPGSAGFWSWNWWHEPARVGNLTLRDLARLDVTTEIPRDIDLAAEVLLDSLWFTWAVDFEGYDLESATRERFRDRIDRQLSRMRAVLRAAATLPASDEDLSTVLDAAGIGKDSLADPWGTRFEFRYGMDVRNRTLTCVSAGPDKQFSTPDDIVAVTLSWNHFTPNGVALDRVVKSVHERSGEYIRDLGVLTAAMREAGVDVERIRDPWGGRYRFEFDVDRSSYRILVRSTRHTAEAWTDDVVWTSSIDYFERPRANLEKVWSGFFHDAGHLPRTDADLDLALQRAGSNFRSLRDPWGNAYFATYYRSFEYGQELTYSANSPAQPITSVTRTTDHVSILSAGADGRRGTPDDFQLATASQAVSEQSARDRERRPIAAAPVTNSVGAIEGAIADSLGGVLPGVSLQCQAETGGERYTATSDARGHFVLSGLPAGMYRVQAALLGFRTLTIRFVPVERGRATPVNLTLAVAGVVETVQVSAPSLEVATRAVAATGVRAPERSGRATAPPERTYTPRVRDYFPETLYWAPSMTTGPSGAAAVSVKLADTITTWKVAVIASTSTGEVGFGEADVEAFQPFFLEHDPPKVLTTGDRIDLPVVLRNYLGQAGELRVGLDAGSWFASRGATSQHVSVAPNGFATVVFPFTATTAVASGRQRVTAVSRGFGDAVEKSVTVHPDGEERHVTTAGLLRDNATLKVALPENVLAGGTASSIRIYPNLLAHLIDGVEATLVRPHGCGEQVISSAYPSILLLKHFKSEGVGATPVARRAGSYARVGLERLRAYRSAEGGFGYWGPGDPDIALTAYAARFLSDASEVLAVPDADMARAASWLISRQEADGSWRARDGDGETLSAMVASALARVAKRLPDGELRTKVQASVRAAASLIPSVRQPYAVGQLALAAWNAGLPREARRGVERLKTSARHEGHGVYWALETNTPFYAWGVAGRIESTAVAVEALETIEGEAASTPLIDAGITFLLSEKDRHGIWHSGHTTVDVLSALFQAFGGPKASANTAAGSAVVLVNGRPAFTLDLPPGTGAGPMTRDVTALIRPGVNTIEVGRKGGVGPYASVQVVSSFYVPWSRSADTRSVVETGASRGLRMAVNFDRTSAQVGEEIRAAVEVERVGHRGYGMLLAEVGLPPGAEIDRASLEQAIGRSGWDLCRYEVQPDRVVFYVWPRAGGTRFSFAFRPRFALVAKTTASAVYDYYNPDEQATLPPAVFSVLPTPVAAESPRVPGQR